MFSLFGLVINNHSTLIVDKDPFTLGFFFISPKIISDPKQQEAEEVFALAMEIMKERKDTDAQTSRPDVIPSYIRNRPVPAHVDPRPRIGPLSENGGYDDESENLYVDPLDDATYTSMNPEAVLGEEGVYLDLMNYEKPTPSTDATGEEQYLDLQEPLEERYKTPAPIKPDTAC